MSGKWLRLAERLAPGATIVTVMRDTGLKYVNTFRARLHEAVR